MSDFLSKILVSIRDFLNQFSGLTSFDITGGGGLFFLFFLLIIFLVALSFGKTRIVLSLLATYIAAFLELIFIYQPVVSGFLGDFLKLPAVFWSRLLTFVAFFVIVLLILNRSILRPKMSLQESPPMTILFLSILQGIFWMAIVSSYAPFDSSIINSSPLIKQYLALPLAQFIWALAPLVALLFLRRKKI